MKCTKYILLLSIIGIITLLALNYAKTPPNIKKIDTVYETDTIWKDTLLTIFKENCILKYVKTTKIDTFYTKDGNDTIIPTENKLYQDTFTCAKDSIIIQNFISGINSKIDSTKVEWKKSEAIITNTVTIEKYIDKKKTIWNRLHFGIQAGYGYTFDSKTLQPYIGFGINLDI